MPAQSLKYMKRYFVEFGGSMLAYIGTLCGVVISRPHDGLYQYVELLPTLPLLFAFWTIIRQYKRMDEYYKRIHSEAFALGGMLLGLFYMIWGFGENAGFPKLESIWVTPGLLLLWALCLPIILSRYK